MEIRDCLQKEKIIIIDRKINKETVLDLLLDSLKTSDNVTDIESLKLAILNREKLMSTGIGLGLAVPHARVDCVKAFTMAVAIVPSGIINYASFDDEPVQIVAMIAAPKASHSEYITLLAKIAALLKQEDIREKILYAETPGQIYDIFVKEKETEDIIL